MTMIAGRFAVAPALGRRGWVVYDVDRGYLVVAECVSKAAALASARELARIHRVGPYA